jgi:ATP-dependent Lhr-like helicase
VASAEQLVSRHGVLTRDAIAFEDVEGGVGALYPVLRSLEEAGRMRRGYFVAGLGGSQFADPGALDRLRALRETASPSETAEEDGAPPAVVLAATDPANPFGAALPWPKTEAARLARAAETHVVLVDGALAAYLGRAEKEIRTFLPAEEPARSLTARGVAFALAAWAEGTGRSALGWARADDGPLAESPLAPFLAEAGFVRAGPGFRWPGTAEDPPGDGES